jgi:hypothetical protein
MEDNTRIIGATKAEAKKRATKAAIVLKLTKTHAEMNAHQAMQYVGYPTPDAANKSQRQLVYREERKVQSEGDAVKAAKELELDIVKETAMERASILFSPSANAKSVVEYQCISMLYYDLCVLGRLNIGPVINHIIVVTLLVSLITSWWMEDEEGVKRDVVENLAMSPFQG